MDLVRSLCSLLSFLLGLYSFVVCVRIIMSWFRYARSNGGFTYEDPYKPKSGMDRFYDFLKSVTDPYLELFRGIRSLKRSRVDFTPVLALIVLNVANTVFSMLARTGRITFGVVLAIAIDSLWGSLVSFILVILIILMLVRYIAAHRNTQKSKTLADALDQILDKPVGAVYRLFFKKSKGVSEQKLVLVSLLFYTLVLIVLGNVENLIIAWLVS